MPATPDPSRVTDPVKALEQHYDSIQLDQLIERLNNVPDDSYATATAEQRISDSVANAFDMLSSTFAKMTAEATTIVKSAKKRSARRWTQFEADGAIRNYLKRHGDAYARLVEAGGKTHQLVREAERLFGRNTIAKALGIPPVTVSRSRPWQAMTVQLKIGPHKLRTAKQAGGSEMLDTL